MLTKRKSTLGVAVASGVGVSVGGRGVLVWGMGVSVGTPVEVGVVVGVSTIVGVLVGVVVSVGVGVLVGMGVMVEVLVAVGVSVGVGVGVVVGVVVSTKGNAAAMPATAPSSRICSAMVRLSPGNAPPSLSEAAKTSIMAQGSMIPQSQTTNKITKSKRNLAPIVRLANHIETEVRLDGAAVAVACFCNFLLETACICGAIWGGRCSVEIVRGAGLATVSNGGGVGLD